MTHTTHTPAAVTASPYLDTTAAAKYIGISPWTLRRMAHNREIKCYQPTPGRYKFSTADLEDFMQANAVEVI